MLIKMCVYVCLRGLQQKYISITRAPHRLCSCVYENEMNLASVTPQLNEAKTQSHQNLGKLDISSPLGCENVFLLRVIFLFIFFMRALNPASIAKRKRAN